MKRLLGTVAIALLAAPAALADEGMWTYDNFPSQRVKEAYGFEPTQDWLDHLRLSSARLAGGCSASFVSQDGLILTNHHCVHRCVEQLSTAQEDLVEHGFLAKTREEERVCPNTEINQLLEIRDVTAQIRKETEGLEGKAYADALRGSMSRIEGECATSPDLRCDLMTLYNGGQYHLYKYKRYRDVRLVWAPELAVGFFGGDPDNFDFPRFNLDAAFLRVWEDGKPATTQHHLRWSKAGAREGELAFVSGHPGRTSRLLTVAELETQRDHVLPERLFYLAELRGMLTEFQNRGPEQRRVANTQLFGVENAFKAIKGKWKALVDPTLMAQKAEEEAALRKWVAEGGKKRAKYAGAWDAIAAAQQGTRGIYDEYLYIEGGRTASGFQSDLFAHARTLVRGAAERNKPSEQRLREYGEANLPALEQRLTSTAPIYPELEVARLTFSLTKLREILGPNHPHVQAILGAEAPESLAKRVVEGSTLGDPQVRKALWEGGAKAVDASKDPMIEFVRKVDPIARQVRATYEEQVLSVSRQNAALIAQARFEAYGTSTYPDATFSLRLSYGTVKGWQDGDTWVAPITQLGGTFERATGEFPYALPKSWHDAKAAGRLDLDTPMNFVTDNDIIGGNSGSPVVNQQGEVIGLIFDGNLPSLGGDYGFDPVTNRAVSVHSQAIVEALDKIYGAQHLLNELFPERVTAK